MIEICFTYYLSLPGGVTQFLDSFFSVKAEVEYKNQNFFQIVLRPWIDQNTWLNYTFIRSCNLGNVTKDNKARLLTSF